MKCSTLLCLVIAFIPLASFGFIGDPAPPLTVQQWIKGGPLEIKPGTNVYVVEIWQTTGRASRAAIPALNLLQNRFKTNGVVVIGVTDEALGVITNFMQSEGTNIHYAVAADQHRATSMAYMEPAGQLGVPYAFVVGTNGNLLWHGHVLRGLDTAVEQAVNGTLDLARSRKLDVASHQMQQYLAMARRRDVRTRAAGMVLLSTRTNDPDLLCDMAFQISTAPQLPRRDFALAGMALKQAEKILSTNNPHLMIYRAVWLFQEGRRNSGLLLATQALAAAHSPVDKANVQSLMNTMLARQAAFKTRRNQTNQMSQAQAPMARGGSMTNGAPRTVVNTPASAP